LEVIEQDLKYYQEEKYMIEFEIMGPFIAPVYRHEVSGVRKIDIDSLKNFWLETQTGERVGVYIFAKKASKGFLPLYIGKTGKAFSKESFSPRNINMLNDFYHDLPKGILVLFLVCHPDNNKLPNKVAIDQVETTLIQYGLKANAKLLNSKKTKSTDIWGINGVLRCGRSSEKSEKLKRCFNIS
jgi:hypothetical protein